METGTYYLGRVIKLGQLDQTKLMDAIVAGTPRTIHKFNWAITDAVDRRNDPIPYVFAKLSKFSSEGQVKLVDLDKKSQIEALARNLLEASSPFVYLPQYSGIAFLHVWNEIQEEVFPRRFKALIEGVYKDFFVDCSIKPVADYRQFVTRLQEMESVIKIEATVNPPNPLFGRLWKPLNDYVKKRNASEVKVSETASKSGGELNTQIIQLVSNVINNPAYAPESPVDIGDSALLMAADGYGKGKVAGEVEGKTVVVRTSDTQKNFVFPKEPDPLALAKEANFEFSQISTDRGMEHP